MNISSKRPRARGRTRRSIAALVGATTTAALMLTGCSGVAAKPGGGDGGFTFTVVTSVPWNTTNGEVPGWFFDEVEKRSDGRITFDRLEAEALCAPTEVVKCVMDGRAEVGFTNPSYTPQYFPDDQLVGVPFLAKGGQAVMESLYELHAESKPLQELYAKNGLRYVGLWSAGRMLLGTKTPADSPNALAGRSVRATGPILQLALKATGANVVALTTSEVYESLERGVIDGAGYSLDGIVNYSFIEQLPYWTDTGYGHYSTFGVFLSEKAYSSLPEDLRSVVDEVTDEFNRGEALKVFDAANDALCQKLYDAPTLKGLSSWSEQATDDWKAMLGDSPADLYVQTAAETGVADPKALLDRYTELLAENDDPNYVDPATRCVEGYQG